MSASIEGATGAPVYYHTGVFAGPQAILISAAAAVGVGLLVFGVVAYLKSLPGLPPAALYASMATGGVLVLASGVGGIILEVKHRKKLEVYGDFLKRPGDAEWCKKQMDAIEPTQDMRNRVAYETGTYNGKRFQVYFISTSAKFDNRQIHVFVAGEEGKKFFDNLILNCNFQAQSTIQYFY